MDDVTNVISLDSFMRTHPIAVERKTREELAQEKYRKEIELVRRFQTWLANARPGDKFNYYTGAFLCGNKVGGEARQAYDFGHVTLFQKRLDDVFTYWAVKLKNG
jgi:hypothetical protein